MNEIDASRTGQHAMRMERLTRTFSVLIAAAALAMATTGLDPVTAQDHDGASTTPFIGVTTFTNTAETQAMIDGMLDQLAVRSHWLGETFRLKTAFLDTDLTRGVKQVQEFVNNGADILIAINRPSIHAVVSADTRIPLVVAGVSLEIAEDFKRKRQQRNVTGIVFGTTHNEQLELIRKLKPSTKTVAVPIDAAEGKIERALKDLIPVARQFGLTITVIPISIMQNKVHRHISDLDPATSAILLDRALLPTGQVEALIAAAERSDIPVFATDEESVIRGAVAAMVVEPFGVGIQLGDLVATILEEPAATSVPFERAQANHLILNQDARAQIDAKSLEKNLPPEHRSLVGWADIAGPRPRIKPSAPKPPPPLGMARSIEVPTPRAKPSRPPE
ncbi:MAG TPA: hypothetical protein DIT35_02225 [Rhodospirillaceae bacterium]|nr:hypothetical protein [Rhodospirillaceae bacterium]